MGYKTISFNTCCLDPGAVSEKSQEGFAALKPRIGSSAGKVGFYVVQRIASALDL